MSEPSNYRSQRAWRCTRCGWETVSSFSSWLPRVETDRTEGLKWEWTNCQEKQRTVFVRDSRKANKNMCESLSPPAMGQRRRLVFGLSDLTKYWELDFLASVAKSEDQQNFQNCFSQAQMRLILYVWKWESTKLPESRYHRKSSGWLVSHVRVNDFVCNSCAWESTNGTSIYLFRHSMKRL